MISGAQSRQSESSNAAAKIGGGVDAIDGELNGARRSD